MKLKEALRIETIHNEHNPDITDAERWTAHELLLEAGKFYLDSSQFACGCLLPGQTPETGESCRLCGIAHTSTECPDRGGTK